MVQTLVVCNQTRSPVTITGLQIDLLGSASETVSKRVPISQLEAQTAEFAGMTAQGMGVFFYAQILDETGIEGVCGDGATLSTSADLEPGGALLLTSQYFAADFAPKEIIATATFRDEAENFDTSQLSLKVKKRNNVFDYSSPLKGAWLIRGFPNIAGHHRYIPSNEFALDFFKSGEDGALDRGGRGDATDDYGHGAPVLAVADGEVVFVINDQIQDPTALSKRDDETVEEARRRITQYQMRRFAENFRGAAAGNMITIKHEKDGVTEYSSYAHLQHGSIDVKVGDQVKRGEKIGAVGNTGDSTLTHLHFQLNDGPDAFHSRSLPINFADERSLYIGQDPGIFMIFGEEN